MMQFDGRLALICKLTFFRCSSKWKETLMIACRPRNSRRWILSCRCRKISVIVENGRRSLDRRLCKSAVALRRYERNSGRFHKAIVDTRKPSFSNIALRSLCRFFCDSEQHGLLCQYSSLVLLKKKGHAFVIHSARQWNVIIQRHPIWCRRSI